MKELSVEQKAEAYDEAIEGIQEILSSGADSIKMSRLQLRLQGILPELKESEDEKIRNFISNELACLRATDGKGSDRYEELTNAIACLEKQGESIDKIEPKFHEGDWVVVSTTKGDRVVQIVSVGYFKDGYPIYYTTDGRWFGNGTKARLLTDKDTETITIPESKVIIKQKSAEWSEEDESKRNALISLIEEIKNQPLKRLEDWDGYISWLKQL